MSPALKAMVEAMAAELNAQAKIGDRVGNATLPMKAHLEATGPLRYRLDGRFDLEKVARAGLEALKPADEATLSAMRQSVPVDGHEWEYVEEDAQEHWSDMIDAILKDHP